ncbi:MAG: hypothetical protein EBT21_05005, partial [Actinobacteria bacterium]|nr:hypothetical protein [Actinomycetota bacterium]
MHETMSRPFFNDSDPIVHCIGLNGLMSSITLTIGAREYTTKHAIATVSPMPSATDLRRLAAPTKAAIDPNTSPESASEPEAAASFEVAIDMSTIGPPMARATVTTHARAMSTAVIAASRTQMTCVR